MKVPWFLIVLDVALFIFNKFATTVAGMLGEIPRIGEKLQWPFLKLAVVTGIAFPIFMFITILIIVVQLIKMICRLVKAKKQANSGNGTVIVTSSNDTVNTEPTNTVQVVNSADNVKKLNQF